MSDAEDGFCCTCGNRFPAGQECNACLKQGSEARLADALARVRVTIMNEEGKDGLDLRGGCYRADTLVTSARGKVMFPDALASDLLRIMLGKEAPARPHASEPQAIDVRDSELRAMAVIAGQLTSLDNPDAVSRILRYFNDRYGDGDD